MSLFSSNPNILAIDQATFFTVDLIVKTDITGQQVVFLGCYLSWKDFYLLNASASYSANFLIANGEN